MNEITAQILREATRDFYARVQSSFSATRQSPWDGWVRIAEIVEREKTSNSKTLRLLDVGCGNMRFEKFLAKAQEAPGDSTTTQAAPGDGATTLATPCIDAIMLDACNFDDANFPGKFIQCDILEGLNAILKDEKPFDLVIAFGVMHHIPMQTAREQLLLEMIELTCLGGIIAVSFWQPLHDLRIARKAKTSTQLGCERLNTSLSDDNDLLLDWKEEKDVFRYCRHFVDEEIANYKDFAEKHGCITLDAFTPCEGSDKLNYYLVLKKAT